jgi:hypothetical protein
MDLDSSMCTVLEKEERKAHLFLPTKAPAAFHRGQHEIYLT